MSTRGIIFDCDGTLLSTMNMWHEIENDLARRAGLEPSSELAAHIAPLTLPEVAEYFHFEHGLGSSAATVLNELTEAAIDGYGRYAHPRPGIPALLESLAQVGIHMAVASSSSPAMLRAGLTHANLWDYFDAVYSVDDVGESKRNPKIYHAARDAMGLSVAETWGAEDAIYAIRTLNAAGYRSIGIYECDSSGTWDEISTEALLPIRTWENFDISQLGIGRA